MKFSLRNLLIVPFLAQVIGLTGIVGYLSYRSGERAVTEMTQRLMAKTGQQADARLDGYLQRPRFVTDSTVYLLEAGHLPSAELVPMEQYFVNHLQQFPELTDLTIANEAGAFLHVTRQADQSFAMRQRYVRQQDGWLYHYRLDAEGLSPVPSDLPRRQYDPHRAPPEDPWYATAQAHPDGLWRLVVSLDQGYDKPQLVMVRFKPFYGPDGEMSGVVGAGIGLVALGSLLEELAGDGGQLLLIEPNGNLVATSTGEQPFDAQARPDYAQNVTVQPRRLAMAQSHHGLTQAVAAALQGNSPDFRHLQQPVFLQLRYESHHYYVNFIPMEGDLDWGLITVVPAAEFMTEIYLNVGRTVLFCALTLMGTIGLGLWTAG